MSQEHDEKVVEIRREKNSVLEHIEEMLLASIEEDDSEHYDDSEDDYADSLDGDEGDFWRDRF